MAELCPHRFFDREKCPDCLHQRIEELETACSSCYDAQQRAQDGVYRLQAQLDAVKQFLYDNANAHLWQHEIDEFLTALEQKE